MFLKSNSLWVCGVCGSWLFFKVHLCEPCERWLSYQKSQSKIIDGYPFQVRPLYVWGFRNEHCFSQLIVSLKNNKGSKKIWRQMALQFLSHHIGQLPKAPVIVPAPCRNRLDSVDPVASDHAYEFSTALSEAIGAKLVTPLYRKRDESQKTLSRRSRHESSHIGSLFDMSEYIAQNHTIVFVDDLLTTGATARSAYIALDKPARFEVWTLMYRPQRLSPGAQI